VLSFQERYGSPKPSRMNLKEAVAFALRLLITAAEFDSATGGVNPEAQTYATIKILRGGGLETVSDEQQAEWLKTG
jgi:proteasome beta subunit